eukprot:TRINITY_DN7634_c0_g1_i1.p1 TRINITY_DN7634_c0_g1~~TRINITY_DN7634_c0_g1_i1.p1  ORF type:complete len:168 (+),score=33.15 TRINITY_DN7634_c0_g1_i1:63-566(+)
MISSLLNACTGQSCAAPTKVKRQSINTDRVTRTDVEWRARLTNEEYRVLRQGSTERAHVGEYNKFQPKTGYFACRGCDAPLYSAGSKFPCSCGWPAFDKAYKGFVATSADTSLGMNRTEITCAMCDSHLGHVFTGERMTDTNQRHCVNSISIVYVQTGPGALPEGKV